MRRSPSPPSNSAVVRLPVGLLSGGRVHRCALLSPPTGDRLLHLLELDFRGPRELLVSEALAQCVAAVGPVRHPAAQAFHDMTLCDRHALVAALLVAAGAPDLGATAECGGCGRRLELTLDLRTVQLPRHDPRRPLRLTRRRGRAVEHRPLRLPTARDLDGATTPETVLARCLGTEAAEAREWLADAERALGARDPLADITLVGTCEKCGRGVTAGCDIVAAWLAWLRRRATDLLSDVHRLAHHYHWCERDILDLPPLRRRSYLDLCGDAVAEPEEIVELVEQTSA
jgi:hypothetical protein